jgi:hypothetical protein
MVYPFLTIRGESAVSGAGSKFDQHRASLPANVARL